MPKRACEQKYSCSLSAAVGGRFLLGAATGRGPAQARLFSLPTSNWSDEETNEPLIADHRNFFKVEKWTKDGKVERMLHAGSSLDKARKLFAAAIKHRPRIRLTIRRRRE